MAKKHQLDIQFPSEVQHVDLVHSVCDRVAEIVGLDENQTLNLGLAVREATINAIKHGNRMDARKKVSVRFQFSRSGVVVSIRDRGRGFDPEATPDPTLPENIHRPHGRGFLLMRAFVDRVEVEASRGGGSVVRLYKRVGAPAPPRGSSRRSA